MATHDIQSSIFTQQIPQQIPQSIHQDISQPISQPISINNNISFFNKLFNNKYLLIFIFIIISGIIYYFRKVKKQKVLLPNIKSKNEEYVIADLNGNVIKVLGEYIGDYKKPEIINNKIDTKEYNISSEENNNTKQYDLTQSEMKEIANKLKN
jgi:hypothetical protein